MKKNKQILEEVNDCSNNFYEDCDCDEDYYDYNNDISEYDALEALEYYG